MRGTHSRFVRALEAEYDAALAAGISDGLDAEAAHQRAFGHVKATGSWVLDQLQLAGLYPWNGREERAA